MRRKDRARRDEAKQERRQAILDVAWAMFQTMPYAAITMADVAAGLHLAKGTIYLYFRTKEELFLQVEQEQLEAWLDAFDAALRDRRFGIDDLAGYLAESLGERPGLVRLLAMLNLVLERNIDFDAALSFKQMLVRRMTRTGGLLEASLGFLAPGEGMRLMLRIHALIVGLHSLADPVPVSAEVLLEPGMDVLAVDFNHELSEMLKALLHGMESKNNG